MRPLPTHASTSPLPMSKPHYTPTLHQSGTLCAQCALPIAGRILSASGARFHPQCFTCYTCQTNLELVAFYAEPEKAQTERLDRISLRRSGLPIAGEESLTPDQRLQSEIADGDERAPRFYCHLDYHEHFSPRCKSCKTPIEGEVIIACGAEWHAGHFFCAQCGDPFDSATPFVEKDGYAWCVGCHTNRYSAKCRRCRKPVVDTVVKALGSEWHAECFVCEVSSEFLGAREW
jgi:paxillin